MFKYRPCKSINVDQLFCLLCTTIIASHEGFSANKVITELEVRTGLVPQFYKAYYEMIAGEFSKETNGTVNGMSLEDYNNRFYDAVKLRYDTKHGTDAYNKLPELLQFEEVFKTALLPTVERAVTNKFVSRGTPKEEVRAAYETFYRDFLTKFRFILDEFMVLNSTPAQLWVALSNFAIDMPHVVIGFRKQVSTYNPMFFRENKDNLDSIGAFMKSKKLKFTNYTSTLSIAGVIINAFTMYHYIDKWMGEYGGVISSGSGTYVDADGVLLYGSELQEKMFNNNHATGIDRFETYMKAIDKGSFLYEVARNRYFNLIEWRQNKIKENMIASLSKMPISSKLAMLGLKFGGALTPSDISGLAGIANGDKKRRFEILDAMISEAYETNVDSVIAQSMIDKWVADGEDAKRKGDAENGRYPMNFKYKEKFYSYNKQKFSDLIKGVNALKSLEAAITQMDYTFMSFPVYGYDEKPHELITGVSLSDYLNQIKAVDTAIVIESDIQTDRDLDGTIIIDNIPGRAAEVKKTIIRTNVVDRISLGSLADEDLSLTVDKESDREMLRLLKGRGFNIQVSKENKASSIHDVIYENIANTMSDARMKNALTPTGLVDLARGISAGTTDDRTGFFISKMRYLSWGVHTMAVWSKATHDSSVNSEVNQQNCDIDNTSSISLDIAEGMEYAEAFTPEALSKIYGRPVSDEEIAELKASLFYKAWLSYKFYSGEFDTNKMWTRNKVVGVPYVFINRAKRQPSVLWDVIRGYVPSARKVGEGNDGTYMELLEDMCYALTQTTNRIAQTEFNKDDPYYLPRALCFCINVRTVIEYVFAALRCVEDNIKDTEQDKKDTNSDNNVNVRLLLKNLHAIETLNVSGNVRDKFGMLKTYEDIYNMFFESVPNSDNFNKLGKKGIYKFVFMDSVQHLDNNINDIDEELLQFREVTKVAHLLLSHPGIYVMEFGDAKHSISEFINLMMDILTLEKRHADEEYFTDSIAMSSIDEKTQRTIANKLEDLVKKSPADYMYDESDSWLDNIVEFCGNNGMSISKSIVNSIHLNYERYSINQYGFITLDNKVVHTDVHTSDGAYKAVITRYGVFGYDGDRVFKINKVRDFRWLLH